MDNVIELTFNAIDNQIGISLARLDRRRDVRLRLQRRQVALAGGEEWEQGERKQSATCGHEQIPPKRL
jgi:hypothetical protein